MVFEVIDIDVAIYSNCDDYLVSSYFYAGFDEEVGEIEAISSMVDAAGVF